jgi:hypothetical protein
MTQAEKKERRKLRHKLAKTIEKRYFSVDFKLGATPNQLKAAGRKVCDQYDIQPVA